MKELVLASGNAHKAREVREILGDAWIVRDLGEFPGVQPGEETGATFEENAGIKAVSVSRLLPGLPVIADDSGLEVDALGGAPGVRSARYAGPGASDADNCARLLRELGALGAGARSARFRCVIALAREGVIEGCFEGSIEGRILDGPRGGGGFGYDPLFVPEGCDLTFAELGADEKNSMSHRARALARLAAHLADGRPLGAA